MIIFLLSILMQDDLNNIQSDYSIIFQIFWPFESGKLSSWHEYRRAHLRQRRHFTHFFSLLSLILLIILIYKRILQISNGYTISPEEPLLKLLYHGGLEGSDILVQLNYLISEEFNLLEIQFVISFVDFLLLNELELFLIDDILCKLLLGFVVLFLM